MFLSQRKYMEKILDRAHIRDYNPCSTPVEATSKLSAASGPPVTDPTLFRSLAGALQYLTFTHPDITYAVQQLCLFMHDPRVHHFAALKRVLCYIKGTLNHGFTLLASSTLMLSAYSNADWDVARTLVARLLDTVSFWDLL